LVIIEPETALSALAIREFSDTDIASIRPTTDVLAALLEVVLESLASLNLASFLACWGQPHIRRRGPGPSEGRGAFLFSGPRDRK